MKRLTLPLIILLSLMFTLTAFAQDTATPVEPSQQVLEVPPTPAVSQADLDRVIEAANRSEQRAGEMVETTNSILNFFEVLAGLAALVLAVGAIFGFSSIRGLREDVEAERKRIEESRTAMEASLKVAADNINQLQRDYEARLNAGLDAIERERISSESIRSQFEGEIKDVRNRGDNAIRALTLVQLGEQQMGESNWYAAMRTFEDACRLDSDNRAVNYYLGELFIMQRDLEKAEHHLRKAHHEKVSLDADDDGDIFPPAEAALAYVLRLRGDKEDDYESRAEYYASAERRYRKAIRLDEYVKDINGESVYGMLGALCRQANRPEDAIRYYEKASKITPYSSYPINNLAMLYFSHGDVEKARPFFTRAVKLARQRVDNNPSDYWAYFDLINGLIAIGRTDEAKAEVNIILPTIHIRGPLESFHTGLLVLSRAPHPPAEMDYFLTRVERAREQVEADERGQPETI